MNHRHRLLVALVLLALAGAAAVGLGTRWLVRGAARDSFIERIRAETALLAAWIAADPGRDPQQTAGEAARSLGYRITLIARDGVVLGDSAKDRAGVRTMDNHLGRPEVQAARRTGTGESIRLSATTKLEYLYAARLVTENGAVGFVRIAVPSSRMDAFLARFAWPVLGAALLAMLVLTGVAYAAVRRLSRPIELMAEAAEAAAEGKPELAVSGEGPGEVARLAAALNRMREASLAELGEREAAQAFLASVIAGMREGLLLVGPDRRIRLANKALREILRLSPDPAGQMLAEVVRHPVVLDDVETAFTEKREIRESVFTLPGSGRTFELHVTPLGHTDGGSEPSVLVLFFDITRLEALEGMRRDFVANVSHELRTPLTSIKAFVETLVDGGLEDRENSARFLAIIRKHSDRMGALIDDLTDLSLIETGAVQLDMRPIDAAHVSREVAEHLHPLAEERGIQITVELPSPWTVTADRRRLEQMLDNLLSNAIKFNRRGGSVRISGEDRAGRRTIVVQDTGEGIPADSLEKIFRRFHRVDPNRSRELGGTGLGLAIVKHLIRLHGGEVNVESELGRGSYFTLAFPTEMPEPS